MENFNENFENMNEDSQSLIVEYNDDNEINDVDSSLESGMVQSANQTVHTNVENPVLEIPISESAINHGKNNYFHC